MIHTCIVILSVKLLAVTLISATPSLSDLSDRSFSGCGKVSYRNLYVERS